MIFLEKMQRISTMSQEIVHQKVIILVAILTFFSVKIFAGEKERHFAEGNTYYQNGQYTKAVEAYQKIVDMGYESGSVYYNLGNCYYKMQDIGRTILYYERAKRLIPGDEDLKANLALANLAVVDKINPHSEFVLNRIIQWFIHLLPQMILGVVAIGFYLATVVSLVIWIVSRKRVVRLIGLRMSTLFGILFFIFGFSLLGNVREAETNIEAVVLVDKVDVMGAPSDEGVEVFSLHEGTKVRIDQRTKDWIEIILADGKVGWVKQEVLGII
jgi:tetratricopeptide (TPR) repeat protein